MRSALLAALLLAAPVHEIHSTLTVARFDAAGLELRIRVFADDLAQVVADHAGRPVAADSSVRAPDLARYLDAHVSARDAAGVGVALESCGVERVREVYLLCLRSAPRGAAVTWIRNSLLTDLHADQVNVVQVLSGADRRSHLLTRDAPTVVIAASAAPR